MAEPVRSYVPPVRLCCFQRHDGPICPDGKVMCQLCFDRFEIDALSRDENGIPQDVCKVCAALETAHKGKQSQ